MAVGSTNLDQFTAELIPQNIKPMQIISIALGMGVIVFYTVIAFLYSLGNYPDQPTAQSADFSQTLTIIHFALSVGASFLAPMMYYKVLGNPQAASGSGILGLMRTAEIVRLAIYEGVAFFGAVTCFLTVQSGVMAVQPLFWLNAITALILLMQIWRNFPTPDRLIAIFRARLEQ